MEAKDCGGKRSQDFKGDQISIDNCAKSIIIVAPLQSARRRHCRQHTKMATFKQTSLLVTVFLVLVCLTIPQEQVEGAKKLKKAAKEIAKELIYSKLTSRKNFFPIPLPIPVPIEINEAPVYLKGKPKYVNVYKPAAKPTPQPVIKPTTVYHMPIYSPTYEYMSMDPMSMYAANSASGMMPAMYQGSMGDMYGGGGKMKSSVSTDSDSTSSSAGMNFDDYDDESGNYYMRKSASRRRRLAAAQASSSSSPAASQDYYDPSLSRADGYNSESDFDESDSEPTDSYHSGQRNSGDLQHQRENQFRAHLMALVAARQSGQLRRAHQSSGHTDLTLPIQDEEKLTDHDYNHDGHSYSSSNSNAVHKRTKRQVYYQSGYDGQERCPGFPLEINVRSRIKMDQLFPIHGKSQFKKCIKVGKPLLPPVSSDSY